MLALLSLRRPSQVEDLARRGELQDVYIEMIDSMSRTMRFSLGPILTLGGPVKATTASPSRAARPEAAGLRILVTVEFPTEYPFGAMPRFSFRAVRDEENEEDEEEEEEEGEEEGEQGPLEEAVGEEGLTYHHKRKPQSGQSLCHSSAPCWSDPIGRWGGDVLTPVGILCLHVNRWAAQPHGSRDADEGGGGGGALGPGGTEALPRGLHPPPGQDPDRGGRGGGAAAGLAWQPGGRRG